MDAYEVWAQVTGVRLATSFSGNVPSISGPSSQDEFEGLVEDAARKHLGPLAGDRDLVLHGFTPQCRDVVTSTVALDGMDVDWAYVDGVAQQYQPAWAEGIPVDMEYTVSVQYRHELAAGEEDMNAGSVERSLLLRASQLAMALDAGMSAAAGFEPTGVRGTSECGYDKARG